MLFVFLRKDKMMLLIWFSSSNAKVLLLYSDHAGKPPNNLIPFGKDLPKTT